MFYRSKELPVGRASRWTRHEISTPYPLGSKRENVKCLTGWLLEENLESLAAPAPLSQFWTSSTSERASDLVGEEATGSSERNLMQLEWYLSVYVWMHGLIKIEDHVQAVNINILNLDLTLRNHKKTMYRYYSQIFWSYWFHEQPNWSYFLSNMLSAPG